MALAECCHQITATYPKEEMYGLTAQTHRSAISIAANFSEGHGRDSTGAFVPFLRNAQGSLKKLETHLLLAGRVRCTSPAKTEPLLMKCDELGRMLRSVIRSVRYSLFPLHSSSEPQ